MQSRWQEVREKTEEEQKLQESGKSRRRSVYIWEQSSQRNFQAVGQTQGPLCLICPRFVVTLAYFLHENGRRCGGRHDLTQPSKSCVSWTPSSDCESSPVIDRDHVNPVQQLLLLLLLTVWQQSLKSIDRTGGSDKHPLHLKKKSKDVPQVKGQLVIVDVSVKKNQHNYIVCNTDDVESVLNISSKSADTDVTSTWSH